jgi:hypothetical protein
MTSLRQIEANRHNALKTGPKTEDGKQRSPASSLKQSALQRGVEAMGVNLW